ncbi:NYN domain-containing protein [Skermania piniformis]|uniref:NYN domain-containing protein n=1 Tax=Skermania pinensis TaxID=39122 RepID=A0ABX8SG32_9ACTN|nr:NYN domain-containing protein [Skermania piniformis]
MTRPTEPVASRVAVYIDFDNIVISRYDQKWGRGKFHAERLRSADVGDDAVRARIEPATVDIGAILDYASSFGTIVASQAYADWSVPVNAGYRQQLLGRAVELVQLFPSTRGMKNGADIRLAVDVVEDLFRLPELTHVVIVAGDSDYIALAQRAKRLGRFVVGIGVAGSTSRSLAAACDEFADYDALPGARAEPEPVAAEPATTAVVDSGDRQADASALLERALRVGQAQGDDDWLHANVVKAQMKRMDPSFNEKSLGFRSFTDFVRARPELVELTEDGQARLLRLIDQPGT